jgi:ankyrin repeat protein
MDPHNEYLWAVAGGKLDEIKNLLTSGKVKPSYRQSCVFQMAICDGNLDIVEYLLSFEENSNVDMAEHLHTATYKGHLHIVKYFMESYEMSDIDYFDHLCMAASNGHLDVVKYFIEEKDIDPLTKGDELIVIAYQDGSINVVDWLRSYFPDFDESKYWIEPCDDYW